MFLRLAPRNSPALTCTFMNALVGGRSKSVFGPILRWKSPLAGAFCEHFVQPAKFTGGYRRALADIVGSATLVAFAVTV